MSRLGAFARGKNSWGICDFCGQVWPYLSLRRQLYQVENLQQKAILTNWMVCPPDYDPTVQIKIIKSDPQALHTPRVDNKDPPVLPPAGSNIPDSQGYIWDTVMTNTWAPAKPGDYPAWISRTVRNFTHMDNIATATVPHNHYPVGATILVEGAANPVYNGLFKITQVLTPDMFTYQMLSDPGSDSPGGTVTRLITSSADY